MAQKKKNLKQQKQKQKQYQKQQVIVNVITSKKRRSTKKTKGSSSTSSISSTPLIQSFPIQYTPYTMYDTTSLLTEANRRSLFPTEEPTPLTKNVIKTTHDENTQHSFKKQLADATTEMDTFLEDPKKQSPKVNDIMDNVEKPLAPTPPPKQKEGETFTRPKGRPPIPISKTPAYAETDEAPSEFENDDFHYMSPNKSIKCEICNGTYKENYIVKTGIYKDEPDYTRHINSERHKKALLPPVRTSRLPRGASKR